MMLMLMLSGSFWGLGPSSPWRRATCSLKLSQDHTSSVHIKLLHTHNIHSSSGVFQNLTFLTMYNYLIIVFLNITFICAIHVISVSRLSQWKGVSFHSNTVCRKLKLFNITLNKTSLFLVPLVWTCWWELQALCSSPRQWPFIPDLVYYFSILR